MNPLIQHEQTLIRGGFLSFFGGFAQQRPDAFVSFNRLLNAHNFDRIIELGTHTAGTSLQFALYCLMSKTKAQCVDPNEPSLFVNQTHHRRPKAFFTYDIVARDDSVIAVLDAMGATFGQADTLNDPGTIGLIRAQVESPGPVLLLCDGGNKKRELELYGGSLKPGDFVCLHDWAFDEAAFEANKANGIWHGWEVRMTDGTGEGQQFGIDKLLERYNIEQIYSEEFDRTAWFCGVKR